MPQKEPTHWKHQGRPGGLCGKAGEDGPWPPYKRPPSSVLSWPVVLKRGVTCKECHALMEMPKQFHEASQTRTWPDAVLIAAQESYWEYGRELTAKKKRTLNVSGWVELLDDIRETQNRILFKTMAEMSPGFLESRIEWIIELIGYDQLVQKARTLRVRKMHSCEVEITSCQRTSQDDNSTGCEA